MRSFIKSLWPAEKKQRLYFVGFVVLAFIFGLIIGGGESVETTEMQIAQPTMWTCSMHPQIQQPGPGKCPICGMDLIPVRREPSHNLGDRQIALSERAQKLARISLSPVERRFVDTDIRLVGKIDYDETRLSYITAWVGGRIERMYVDYTGISVRKGDHMVELYSPEIVSTQQELVQTLHSVKNSNTQMLVENLQSIRERLRLWGLNESQIKKMEESGKVTEQVTINAPMSGIVIARDGLEGMYVEKGMRLYTIADLSNVWLFLEAYESDLQWLRYGQEVTFTTEAYPGDEFNGRIAFIDPVLDDQTRTVKIRVNVRNGEAKLKPGMLVRAIVHSKIAAGGKVMDPDLSDKWICPMHPEVIKKGPGQCDLCGMSLVRAESLGYISTAELQKTASLVIPATAPLLTGKRAVVYVKVPGSEGVFEGREVTLGPRTGDYYIVESGLQEGEMVVTNGNFKIDSAVQIQAGTSMMNPPTDTHESVQVKESHEIFVRETIPDKFISQLDDVYDAYFDLQFALSHDAEDRLNSAAIRMHNALQQIEMNMLKNSDLEFWNKVSIDIKKLAKNVAGAGSLGQARGEFKDLSSAVIQLAEFFGSSGKQPILVYYCPMAFNNAGADWLQNKEGTENPYYGARMFKCGSMQRNLTLGNSERSGDKPENE